MDYSKKPKHENPRKGVSFLSKLFYLWTVPFIWKGMKNGLTTKDLTKCLQEDKSKVLGDTLESEWKRELENAFKNKRKPKLCRALLQLHATELVILGFSCFTDVMLRTMLSLVLAQILIQFQEPIVLENVITNTTLINNSSDINTDNMNMRFVPNIVYQFAHHVWNDAFSLATLLTLMAFSSNLFLHRLFLEMDLLGTRMGIACCSLIYRKSIRLSASVSSQISTGHLVNLMTNDVARFNKAIAFMHFIWILPVQSAIVIYIIWRQARWVAIVGVICLLLKSVPVQIYLSHYRQMFRKKVALRTDKRIGTMNEIIQGIKIIKMYAWEIPFQRLVAEARRMEIGQIRYIYYVDTFTSSIYCVVQRSTLFISILVLFFTGQKITVDIVYSMVQFFYILQLNANFCFPQALSCGGEALVSMKRIEQFLLKEEKNKIETGVKRRSSDTSNEDRENAVELNDVTASWDANYNSETLSKIDLKIRSGELCVVVGPIGSGKSSLIQLLLGELPVQSGMVIVNGSVSYAAQEPWIFSGTVQNNILFGQIYDRKRYNKVVKCCALTTDFQQLAFGDKTLVGDRGASLSGGQRARISLARAMYKKSSIYLLDDPLSAVDAPVGKHLFDELIGPKAQIAENATRILITHQVHLIKEADVIVVLENGRITHRGTYAELSVSDIDFVNFLKKLTEKENKDEKQNEEIPSEDEQSYENNKIGIEFDDAKHKLLKQRTESVSTVSITSQELEGLRIKEEEQVKGSFSWRIFLHYFAVGSTRWQILFLICVVICTQCVISGTDYFVKYLTQHFEWDNGAEEYLTQTEYLYVYGALIIGLIFITFFRQILFYSVCMRSSIALHNQMFDSILHAPVLFFDMNPSGRILNRISSDIGIVDDILPNNITAIVANITKICGILVLIIIVNPAMLATLAFIIVLSTLVLKLYSRSLQDLKRLEGISRSPVLSHLTATVNGLITIRAWHIDRKLCHEFDELQDVHSSVTHLTLASTESFAFWLDCISTIFIACTTYSFIFLYDNSFSEDVGLAISQALTLTGLVEYTMRNLSQMMQQMTNVERIVEYTELEPEHSPSMKPPLDWPNSGNIKFHNISLRYDPEGDPVLNDIRFEIPSRSKIGVVGRTGAGKSSLIAALFRLANVNGVIEIDGVNTKTISLASLRSKISIIPQNPVLFSGSVRYNLDPFDNYSDDQIWQALESVELKSIIKSLDYRLTESGQNFSVGQRQLVCLARAILRENRILILDEATANVDPQTDQLVQKTIREKFASCTVVTIAHRLHTIIDSDRILVMDAGKCVEFDTPSNLLMIENGIFKGMIEALHHTE